jgi:hypothetical protein
VATQLDWRDNDAGEVLTWNHDASSLNLKNSAKVAGNAAKTNLTAML